MQLSPVRQLTRMRQKLSLYILLGAITLIGLLFFQVIRPFLFSLLFAAVLAVLFRPAYSRVVRICFGWRRVAAGVTTALILLVIILPVAGALTMAGIQMFAFAGQVVEAVESPDDSELAEKIDRFQQSRAIESIRNAYSKLSNEQQEQLKKSASKAVDGLVRTLYERTIGLAGDVAGFVVGFLIMTLSLYYFLADGEKILREIQGLSPLDEEEEVALFEQFEKICRGVVMGSVVSALVQAVLAGVGFAFAGVPNIWLLMALTMFCAFIPFVGAFSVYTAISIVLVVEQRYLAAGLLFTYGVVVVSSSDNLIKAYVIGEHSKLNPLVVLITVIGAMQLIGLWGIFVGPMVAAFFYALLKILRDRQTLSEDHSNNEEFSGQRHASGE